MEFKSSIGDRSSTRSNSSSVNCSTRSKSSTGCMLGHNGTGFVRRGFNKSIGSRSIIGFVSQRFNNSIGCVVSRTGFGSSNMNLFFRTRVLLLKLIALKGQQGWFHKEKENSSSKDIDLRKHTGTGRGTGASTPSSLLWVACLFVLCGAYNFRTMMSLEHWKLFDSATHNDKHLDLPPTLLSRHTPQCVYCYRWCRRCVKNHLINMDTAGSTRQ